MGSSPIGGTRTGGDAERLSAPVLPCRARPAGGWSRPRRRRRRRLRRGSSWGSAPRPRRSRATGRRRRRRRARHGTSRSTTTGRGRRGEAPGWARRARVQGSNGRRSSAQPATRGALPGTREQMGRSGRPIVGTALLGERRPGRQPAGPAALALGGFAPVSVLARFSLANRALIALITGAIAL